MASTIHNTPSTPLIENMIRETNREECESEPCACSQTTNSLFYILRGNYYFNISKLPCPRLDTPVTSLKNLYQIFTKIMPGKERGNGTCTVRAFAAIQSLVKGKIHTYDRKARMLVTLQAFSEHFKNKVGIISPNYFDQFPHHQLFLFARNTAKKTNSLFGLRETSSQISHVFLGSKLDGEIYVWDLKRDDTMLFETLKNHQQRLLNKNRELANLFLPVGVVCADILLDPSPLLTFV